ncbi:MAG: glycosyltransferase [Phycisphaerales bacterium]
MAEFRHYILTRFNVDLYGPVELKVSRDQWMDHRMRLFTSLTLPSIAGQSCQDFTWLLLMDRRTPEHYIRTLQGIGYPNLQIIYPDPGRPLWLDNLPAGSHDLITTRIDNDDAFQRDAVKAVHDAWRARHEQQTKPWLIVFPFGLILDLADRRMWVMEYWLNNCPTLVEDSQNPGTVYRWQHSEIPPEVPRHHVKDRPYWLQVIHSQNLLNAVRSNNPLRIVHEELPGKLEFLYQFGIDPAGLPPS